MKVVGLFKSNRQGSDSRLGGLVLTTRLYRLLCVSYPSE